MVGDKSHSPASGLPEDNPKPQSGPSEDRAGPRGARAALAAEFGDAMAQAILAGIAESDRQIRARRRALSPESRRP